MIQHRSYSMGDGSSNIDEQKASITIIVQFGRYQLSRDQCSVSGSYASTETFEVDPSMNFPQLQEHIKKNCSFTWNELGPLQFLATCKKGREFWRVNDQDQDLSLTVGQYYEQRPKKQKYPRYNYVPVQFGLADQADVELARHNREMRTNRVALRFQFFKDQLRGGGYLFNEETLVELLTFPWTDCPYNYVDIPEGSVPSRDEYIKSHRAQWEQTVSKEFDILLSEWLLQSNSHRQMIYRVLTERTAKLNEFSNGGHGGRGLSIILHYCQPYAQESDQPFSSYYANEIWRGFWKCIPPCVHLKFLKNIAKIYKTEAVESEVAGHPFADPNYVSPLGGSHSVGAFVRWAQWATTNMDAQARREMVWLKLAHRKKDSYLSTISGDLCAFICQLIWQSREQLPDHFLIPPPGRNWLD